MTRSIVADMMPIDEFIILVKLVTRNETSKKPCEKHHIYWSKLLDQLPCKNGTFYVEEIYKMIKIQSGQSL